MSDIVERLRACPGLGDPECHCAEAADEIERLREALATCREVKNGYYEGMAEWRARAEKAERKS